MCLSATNWNRMGHLSDVWPHTEATNWISSTHLLILFVCKDTPLLH